MSEHKKSPSNTNTEKDTEEENSDLEGGSSGEKSTSQQEHQESVTHQSNPLDVLGELPESTAAENQKGSAQVSVPKEGELSVKPVIDLSVKESVWKEKEGKQRG